MADEVFPAEPRNFPHFSTLVFTKKSSVLLTLLLPDRDTGKVMARYSSFLGHRVEVQYRASDTLVPASGVMVADSGRSIFLEQTCEQRGLHHHFRWEIPYQYLIRIALTRAEEQGPPGQPSESPEAHPAPTGDAVEDKATRTARAAAAASIAGAILPLGGRSHST
jgi:hypothetical protein